MRRNGPIALGIVGAAAVIVVVALAATGSFSKSGASKGKSPTVATSGPAPACLPSKVNLSAELPGTEVEVSPGPETNLANPATQISFLGVPASEISEVKVSGSRSGAHAGKLEPYSQGDGASFVPSKPFTPGERVTVSARIGTTGAQRSETFSFEVDTPYSTSSVKSFENPKPKASEYETFDTIPGMEAPRLSVSKAAAQAASAGDIFTSNGPGPGKYGALIYAPDGRLIWFDQLSKGLTADDVNLQEYEGRRDLTLWQGKVLSLGYGDGEDLVLGPHYEVVAKVHAGNGLMADLHEFRIEPHGVAFLTAYNPIRCNLSSVEEGPSNSVILDATFQEVDMKTGLVMSEWHALGHLAANESETAPPKERPWDWFHLNSIDLQSNGDVFISARNTWAGYEIEARTGKIAWSLGGLKSTFKLGPGVETHWQHDGRILSNGEVTFFDDGANQPKEPQSRGVQIKLNFKTHQATLTKAYTHPAPLLAASQGDMQTMRSGNVLLGYGGVAQISEFSKSGSLIYDAHLPYDFVFYRAYRHPWQATPKTAPAIAANLNNTAEETVVHASWNGATDVASWRVLAGKSASSLKTVETIPDEGFESSTILTPQQQEPATPYAYVQVQALSSTGKALASSRVVKAVSYAASLEGEEREES
ncbi:MAG: arylsulfotransferase family protein [Solirubrobacteraceae bacterium]